MPFDRLLYIDRLKEAGVEEAVARAHAEALRDALLETVATKTDLAGMGAALRREIQELDRKIEITARDLTIRGFAGVGTVIALMIALKFIG